jgi:ATP-binding cassette subfamily B protein
MTTPRTVSPTHTLKETDWRLFQRLVPYGLRYRQLFIVSMLLLLPVSIAGAIQPALVGEAILPIHAKGA